MADAHVAFSCFNCDETFHRRSSGASDARKCCSRKCGFEWQAKVRGLRRPISFTIRKGRCLACSKPFTVNGTQSYCTAECRQNPATSAQCGHCGVSFLVPKNSHGKFCEACRPTVMKQRKKEYHRLSGAKAAARKARKLRLRGVAVEAVNPLIVLDRDKWTCQLCGVKTPERLRGTYDARAPEVDHIIPLAEGGEHSYRNTQCACRQCNLAKSSRPMGQMRLFG